MASYIPTGYAAVVPYLLVDDAPKEIEFMTAILGGTQEGRLDSPDGKVMNARVNVGGSPIMIGSTMPPQHVPQTGMLFVYVPDADATYAKAVAMDGVTPLMPMADQFWSDRAGALKTANGVTYWIATGRESVTHEQIAERMGMKK